MEGRGVANAIPGRAAAAPALVTALFTSREREQLPVVFSPFNYRHSRPVPGGLTLTAQTLYRQRHDYFGCCPWRARTSTVILVHVILLN